VMGPFDDLQAAMEPGKQCFGHLFGKDVMDSAAAADGWCSWTIEWLPEPMPLEDRAGTALQREVRQMVCDSVFLDEVPEMPAQPPPEPEDILVFADTGGFCHALLDKVPEGRIGSRKIITKPAKSLVAEDFESLLASRSWDMVIFGCSLDAPASSSVADVLERQTEAVKALFALVKTAYLKEGSVKRMAVLTNDIFAEDVDTNKSRGLELTTHATMFGFCNTARQELEFPVQLVDIEVLDCPDLIPHVAADLFRKSTFGVNTVRHRYPYPIRNGMRTNRPSGRYIARQMNTRKYQPANRKFITPETGIVAISGGNGALGLVMGHWLLETAEKEKEASGGAYNPRFTILFLSRSAKVSDLNMPNWKKVQHKAEEMGIKVEQGTIDMSSQEAVDAFVKKNTPNLIGFIHSAGVLRDSMIPNQTWEKFEEVFSSKHWAALYLHEALERFPNPRLEYFWMFSSLSVYGSMGQLNYSSSNSALDALARHRVSLGKPALAIQWGAWGEVGMAATMDETMRRRTAMGPMPYFTVKQGLEGLEGGLRTGLPGFTVYIVNPQVFYGMIASDVSTALCYMRNWSSEWMPTPAPSSFGGDSAYNIYRMYRYLLSPYSDLSPILYGNYIQPRVKADDAVDASNGTIELGFGLA